MNVLLLCMSTLPRDGVTESVYTREGQPWSVTGKSQMEPVAKYLCDKQGLSRILVLNTSQTVKVVKVEGKDVSAYEYFCERMKEYCSNLLIEDVLIDDNEPLLAVNEVVKLLQGFKKDSEEFHLYMDMHGGPRENQLIVDGVVSLLKIYDIHVEQTYTVTYRKGQGVIKDADKAVEVFDIVSGMNEFINYGRSETLIAYYQRNHLSEELINNIQKLADCIQLCDIDGFEQRLDRIVPNIEKELAKNSKDYLVMFSQAIKDDYGKLLDPSERDAVGLLEWCLRKHFYQQAITIVESRMPEYLVQKEVISYSFDSQMLNYKHSPKKPWEKDANFAMRYALEGSKVDEPELALNRKTAEDFWKNEVTAGMNPFAKGVYTVDVTKRLDGSEYHIPVTISANSRLSNDDLEKLNVFFRLHLALRAQRNQVNHASSIARVSATTIYNSIASYIEMVKYFVLRCRSF